MNDNKHLQEAFQMYSGADIPATREQVIAVVQQLLELSKKTEKLHSLMRDVLKKANATRQQMGMPIPQPPFRGPKQTD